MTQNKQPSIVVVGSVNLDIVAAVDELPVAGETVTGAELRHYPGGKGANQALAVKRLGADVYLVARVGNDTNARKALALLAAEGVDLAACGTDEIAPTGVALVTVSSTGENQIVVAPGANRTLTPELIKLPEVDALILQLEVPVETLDSAVASFAGFVCINLAPALEVSSSLISRADLIVVNELEAEFYGDKLGRGRGWLATTYGAKGATLSKAGKLVAQSCPSRVHAVDTTGCGDAFTAALTLAFAEGRSPQAALDFACAAGACAATRAGAQPSLPLRTEVETLLRQSSSEREES